MFYSVPRASCTFKVEEFGKYIMCLFMVKVEES